MDMPEIRNQKWTADFSDTSAPAPAARGIHGQPCSPIAAILPRLILGSVAEGVMQSRVLEPAKRSLDKCFCIVLDAIAVRNDNFVKVP